MSQETTFPSVSSKVSESTIKATAERISLISAESRVRILLELQESPINGTQITAALGTLCQGAISHHLKFLKFSGLVEFRWAGKNKFYSLTASGRTVVQAIHALIMNTNTNTKGQDDH